jgi:hypothetical protein
LTIRPNGTYSFASTYEGSCSGTWAEQLYLRRTENLDVSHFSRRQPWANFRATPTFQNLFEILISLARVSNDAGALLPLRADTVFRAVQVKGWPRKTIHYRFARVFRRFVAQEVPERDKDASRRSALPFRPCALNPLTWLHRDLQAISENSIHSILLTGSLPEKAL